jgi:hypothetical protein
MSKTLFALETFETCFHAFSINPQKPRFVTIMLLFRIFIEHLKRTMVGNEMATDGCGGLGVFF